MLKKAVALLFILFLCIAIPKVSHATPAPLSETSLFEEKIPEVLHSPTESYQIIEKLGAGAFGTVFAVANSQGQRFALKAYRLENDKTFQHRDAMREFERGQQLNHPNIIRSYELFQHEGEGNFYLVLQLIEGRTLYEMPRKILDSQEALIAIRELLDAIDIALGQELVHLDLHPGNVMFSWEEKIFLIDLASFFSFDEIYGFIDQFGPQIIPKNKQEWQVEKLISMPIKEKKLKDFFAQNPNLLLKMQEARHAEAFMLHKGGEPTSKERMLVAYLTFYLDRITDTCIRILSKSSWPREEVLPLKIEMKKIFWQFEADVEENCVQPFQHYLQQLNKLFDLSLSN